MSLFHRTARSIAAHKGPSPTQRILLSTPQSSTSTGAARRSLHLSTLGDAVVLTADSISFVHHAGVPWYLTIPLVALGVNLSLRLPIQYFTRSLVVRRNKLTPLVKAWGLRHAATVPPPAAGTDGAQRLWRLRVAGLTERSRRRIYKTWGVQRWKSLAPLASMAPFIVVTEALRRLCGAPLGWMSRSLGLGSAETAAEVGDTPQRLLDPCLADGGCLWFTDLTAMDPYYLLPVLCSALLAKTAWGRLSREQLRGLLSMNPPAEAVQTPMARIQLAVGRTLLLIPLFPLLFADLPSAIFLYWATAFALGDINEAVLERMLPRKTSTLLTASQEKGRLVSPYLRASKTNFMRDNV